MNRILGYALKALIDYGVRRGEVTVMVQTPGGCAANFRIRDTFFDGNRDGEELTIRVDSELRGGNCEAWRSIHAADHRLSDLHYQAEERWLSANRCDKEGA